VIIVWAVVDCSLFVKEEERIMKTKSKSHFLFCCGCTVRVRYCTVRVRYSVLYRYTHIVCTGYRYVYRSHKYPHVPSTTLFTRPISQCEARRLVESVLSNMPTCLTRDLLAGLVGCPGPGGTTVATFHMNAWPNNAWPNNSNTHNTYTHVCNTCAIHA
jgi:hypothetical protein